MKKPKKKTFKVHILKMKDGCEDLMLVQKATGQKNKPSKLKSRFQTRSITHHQRKIPCRSKDPAARCGVKAPCHKINRTRRSKSCFPIMLHSKPGRHPSGDWSTSSSEDQFNAVKVYEKHHCRKSLPFPSARHTRCNKRRCASASCYRVTGLVDNSHKRHNHASDPRTKTNKDRGECALCSSKSKTRKNRNESKLTAREGDKGIRRRSIRRRNHQKEIRRQISPQLVTVSSLNRNTSPAKTEKKVTFAKTCSYRTYPDSWETKTSSPKEGVALVRKGSPYKLPNDLKIKDSSSESDSESLASSEEVTGKLSFDCSDNNVGDTLTNVKNEVHEKVHAFLNKKTKPEDPVQSDKATVQKASDKDTRPLSTIEKSDWRSKIRRSINQNVDSKPSLRGDLPKSVKPLHHPKNTHQHETPPNRTRRVIDNHVAPVTLKESRVSRNSQLDESPAQRKTPPVLRKTQHIEPPARLKSPRVSINSQFGEPLAQLQEPRASRNSQFGEMSAQPKEPRLYRKSQCGELPGQLKSPQVLRNNQYVNSSTQLKIPRAPRNTQFGDVPALLPLISRNTRYERTYERSERCDPISTPETSEDISHVTRYHVPRDGHRYIEKASVLTKHRVPLDIQYHENPAITRYKSYLEKRHHSKAK